MSSEKKGRITDRKTETCICGAKYETWTDGFKRYNYPNMACHCQCGAKWGEHKYKVRVIQKDYCEGCGKPNKWHINRGNYCISCGGKFERLMRIRTLLAKPQKNRDKINNLLKELKKWHIGIDYIIQSKKELDIINKVLKV